VLHERQLERLEHRPSAYRNENRSCLCAGPCGTAG
jgi:hypothetical protein